MTASHEVVKFAVNAAQMQLNVAKDVGQLFFVQIRIKELSNAPA